MAKRHSEETKAAAMAALLAGQSVSEVAKAYEIPAATLRAWQHRQKNEPVANVTTQKKVRIGELLTAYLEENLATLREQARVFRDAAWLQKQSAADAAILHGVMADKAVRLLEAFGNADPPGVDAATAPGLAEDRAQ